MTHTADLSMPVETNFNLDPTHTISLRLRLVPYFMLTPNPFQLLYRSSNNDHVWCDERTGITLLNRFQEELGIIPIDKVSEPNAIVGGTEILIDWRLRFDLWVQLIK